MYKTPDCKTQHFQRLKFGTPKKPALPLVWRPRAKRSLFSSPDKLHFGDGKEADDTSSKSMLADRIRQNLSCVIDKLFNATCLNEFSTFLELVANDRFPLDNIAFRLFLETVRWFSLTTTTNMWYWDDTTTFWKVGYRILKDKFILFMSGLKSLGQVVSEDTVRGCFDPADSSINFAVPSPSVLRTANQEQFPTIIPPGIIPQAFEAITTLVQNRVTICECLKTITIILLLKVNFTRPGKRNYWPEANRLMSV